MTPKKNDDLSVAKGWETKTFILSPGKDSPDGVASRMAMKAYARSISSIDQDKADSLWAWVQRIERILAEESGRAEAAEIAKNRHGLAKAKGQ